MKFLFTLMLASTFTLNPNAAELVTAGVGQVGGQVVTTREVQISYLIDQHMLTAGAKKNIDRANWLLKENSVAFQKHLSQVMLESLVKMEAESFSIAQVSADQIKQDSQLVRDGFKDSAYWKKLEVSEVELDQIIVRRKIAKNFLRFKTESSGVTISDEEAKIYFEKNRVKFGGAPFPQFKESIKEVLSQQQLEEKLKDWFEILKRKYRVRFLKHEIRDEAKS